MYACFWWRACSGIIESNLSGFMAKFHCKYFMEFVEIIFLTADVVLFKAINRISGMPNVFSVFKSRRSRPERCDSYFIFDNLSNNFCDSVQTSLICATFHSYPRHEARFTWVNLKPLEQGMNVLCAGVSTIEI